MKIKYYKSLDGVRGLAAVMVVIFHFFQYFVGNEGIMGSFKKLSMLGQTGVDLFFVLSGFLITRILIYSKDKENYFSSFYWKRTLRIFPLYYFFLILYYYIAPYAEIVEFSNFKNQIYHFTFLQNIGLTFDWNIFGPNHYWSLAVEEHFYLFWPLIVFGCGKKALARIVGAIIIIAFLLRMWMLSENIGVFYFTFTRFDGLAFGALLAIRENSLTEKNRQFFIKLLVASAIPIFVLFALSAGKENMLFQTSKFLLLSAFYFALIGFVLCINQQHFVSKFFNGGFLQYTGKISYGLYVYHPLIILLVSHYLSTGYLILDFIILVALSYFVSAISFKYFESFFLKFKHRLPFSKNAQVHE